MKKKTLTAMFIVMAVFCSSASFARLSEGSCNGILANVYDAYNSQNMEAFNFWGSFWMAECQ